MYSIEKLEKILNEKVYSIEETSYGVTNNNFIVTTNKNKYFYRTSKDSTKIVNKDKIIAVLKADAYGHGMMEICKALLKINIKHFAVATVDEALKIKEMGDDIKVIILGPIQKEDMEIIYDKNKAIKFFRDFI